MQPRISLKKIWFDDDVTELKVVVCDGVSLFETDVYIASSLIEAIIKDLHVFGNQIHGGLYDLKLGEFGPEYANGAFHARLHFYVSGRLCISTSQQSGFFQFANHHVASEAKMYLKTEPVLLDNFISELKLLNFRASDQATLLCV